jgi:hypothetical protein
MTTKWGISLLLISPKEMRSQEMGSQEMRSPGNGESGKSSNREGRNKACDNEVGNPAAYIALQASPHFFFRAAHDKLVY